MTAQEYIISKGIISPEETMLFLTILRERTVGNPDCRHEDGSRRAFWIPPINLADEVIAEVLARREVKTD